MAGKDRELTPHRGALLSTTIYYAFLSKGLTQSAQHSVELNIRAKKLNIEYITIK